MKGADWALSQSFDSLGAPLTLRFYADPTSTYGVLATQPARVTDGSSSGFVASLVAVALGQHRCPAFIRGENKNAANRYLMGFAQVTVPANGTVPLPGLTLPIAPASTGTITGLYPCDAWYSTGLILVLSSTFGTLTLAAADVSLRVQLWQM